jgi:Transcriptional regulator, AbiEi antitoxin
MRDKPLPRSRQGGHTALAELAARQHGVVSIRQLLRLGYSRSAVARAKRAGRLHSLHRGVYAVGHTRISTRGDCLAAILACGPRALLSHGSAAWLWGVWNASPRPIAVTAPVPRGARKPIRLHHSRTLEAEDRALVEGIPVTAVPRTLLDFAAITLFRTLERALERAEERGLLDLGPVEALLGRNLGHAGAQALRRALALYRAPTFTRSGFERRFLEIVREAGLPPPRTAFNELGYELDVYWPELCFAVELDSFATHGTRAAFERDRRRQEDLKLGGIEMIRVTERSLEREPLQVVERLHRLLERRRLGS